MENAKILIVDDDPDFTVMLKTVLEGEGYVVDTAPGRAEGMEKIQADKPDLLLLDVMMVTWSDGFEMARDIRKNPEYKDMPIIMLTGVEQRTGIGFKSSAGDPEWLPVDGFLDKPVEPHVLIAEVKKVMSDKP
ncbi:MAG: response regulator transcription factor [Phycisphaerae bacterium]|nr:response regulator transcription factor [Phycisphaerae bacterium]